MCLLAQVGVFSAAAVLVYDLSEPFLGQYLITPTVLQLKTIRDTLPTGTDDADAPVISALPSPTTPKPRGE